MTASSSENPNEKMYAGKFKSVEELEEGYKSSAKVFQENQDLKKKLDELSSVPDDYMTPKEVGLNEDSLKEIKAVAKNSGLTQVQYEKLARETFSRVSHNVAAFETAKKEVGADNINLMQDYLKKTYGEKAADVILEKAITDKSLRDDILAQRTKSLNSTAPGVGGVAPYDHQVTQKDVLAAREEMNNARGKARVELQRKYISLSNRLAHQKDAG